MDVTLRFRELMEGGYLMPVLLVLAFLLLYFGANSLFRGIAGRIRRSLKGTGLPLEATATPFRLLVELAGISLVLRYLPLPEGLLPVLHHLLLILSIVGAAWFMMRLLVVLEQAVLHHYESKTLENSAARRKVATHASLARKILNVLFVVLAVSSVLMTFDTVRQVGVSILASAGIAGVIIGFAAQKSLSTLIAGVQIAVTQPISIDDVVVVEKEWGKIEEITLTYVVVQIWDQRRLIVPISRFIDQPFENWSRISPELLGTVFFYVDYAIPVESLRQELERTVAATPLWDGRVVKLHVTKTTERSLEVRALMSARNSSDAWELRCLVREQMVGFIRENYPAGLPRVRMEMDQGSAPVVEG
ncbi:mechanosensitive ion channel family protein [Chlorobium sp. N1]|uniref:mechanosensitive ion channel family protein n=1 Tax=Chlorobium sp. N1 TaxID=2491138 RepID=UPI00103B28DE|nr:mechanosensitive ion channel family protein [Chlorobium sp. N1]TCD47869.1 mechanosensitive ion channel family protein [Chlorobium sp. N1]